MLLADSKSKSTVFRNRFDSFKITIRLRNNQPAYLTISRAVFYILHCMTTTVEYNELYRGEIGELQEESSEKSRDMRILKNCFRGPPNNQLTDYNPASRLAPWLQHNPSPIISLSSTDWGSKESWDLSLASVYSTGVLAQLSTQFVLNWAVTARLAR